MQDQNLNAGTKVKASISIMRWFAFGLLALVVLIAGFYAWSASSPRSTVKAAASEAQVETLSAEEFEQRYGLRVRLIAVTAGGGMIDFRLKVIDAEKARPLLMDPTRMPSLIVPESGLRLVSPPNPDQDPNLEDGDIYFLFYSNTEGAIKTGTPVIVSFGDFQVEPVAAH